MPTAFHQQLTTVRRLVFAAAMVALTAPLAQAQLVVYDDFSGGRIDETRWAGRQLVSNDRGTGSLLEIQREVTNAQVLMMQARVVSGRGEEPGRYSVDNAVMFNGSNALHEVAFDAVIRRVDVSSCTAGADAEAGARGVFPLFNDGLGDVIAIIAVTRSSRSNAPAGELDVTASLVHRTEEANTPLGFLSLGTATVGRSVRLRTRWDPARNRVRFQRDADPLASIDYINPVIAGPGRPRKHLAVTASVGDCSSGSASASVVAALDNVRVNP